LKKRAVGKLNRGDKGRLEKLEVLPVERYERKVLFQIVIPIRYGSMRLPGKPLLSVAGKPLLQHVWERARASRVGGDPIIATDDRRIVEAANSIGAPVMMTHPSHRCGSERVAEVAQTLSADVIINLQGDEVLIDPELLAAFPSLFQDSSVEMATAVVPIQDTSRFHDPSLVKAVLDDRQDVLYFSRSAIPYPGHGEAVGLDPVWHGHVGVYAYTKRLLLDIYRRPPAVLERMEGLEQLRALQAGVKIRALIWQKADFGVNTLEDLDRVRTQLEFDAK
jgi:3-deoxy-manno-octulosonate cytidylyltransferase (CMP-KDO synthetase)